MSVPSLELGPPTPSPLPQASVLPPEPKGGGEATHSLACDGMGESQFGRLERKLSTVLCLLSSIVQPQRDITIRQLPDVTVRPHHDITV